MKLYDFLSELLTDIEELQKAVNRIRETVKTRIKEASADERRVPRQTA